MLKEAIRETPATKDRKLSKFAHLQTLVNEAMAIVVNHMEDAENRMVESEERRLAADDDLLGRLRQENRDHELAMARILAGMQSARMPPPREYPFPNMYS